MPTTRRPNILLITSDQQRFDSLGCNGNTLVRTPNLDSLARRGVNFQNAFVQNTVCIPSRACIQTGRYTHQHGVDYMEDVIDDTPGLPAWEVTFMERLQAAGYYTGAFGKLHMYPHKGFHEMQVCGGKGARWRKSAGEPVGLGPLGRDYAAWLEAKAPGAYEKIYAQRREEDYTKYKSAIPNVLPLEQYVDYWIAQNTIDFVGRGHDRPFFAWCGFCGPHVPVDPPKPYDTMYPADSVPLPPNYGIGRDGKPVATTPEQDAIARRFIGYYYGLVTMLDDMVGRIVETLKAKGLLDDTLIIYTSDHGELMFELGRTGKILFNDSVVRVPLIVAPPSLGSGQAAPGCRDALVEVFDIAPTALDYASAAVPADMAASSLRPLVEAPAPGQGQGKQFILSEFVGFDRSFTGVCLRTKDRKYVQWTDARGDEFFDLTKDPLERNNLLRDPAYREDVERHRTMLISRLLTTGTRMSRAEVWQKPRG
jgi:arylsulfatase